MTRKSVFSGVAMAVVFALCSIWVAEAAPVSEHVSMTGYISCTTCLLPNACKAQTRLSCVQWWVNQGASYVLVVGNDRYRLSGSEQELKKAAGDTVTISGELEGHDLVVTNVVPTHKEK